MQKLDFVNSLEVLVNKLQSVEIVSIFEDGFKDPRKNFPFNQIVPLLFISKSNFDQLKNEKNLSTMLKSIGAEGVYTEINLSVLTSVLVHQSGINILINPLSSILYNFHATLVSTYKLSKNSLLNSELSDDIENSIEKGIIIFQIVIEGDGLETDRYIKIFEALKVLVETISKVFKHDDVKSEVILLDSGSDTNVGIKTGVEIAKSLFSIFKEIWDFVVNFRYYKSKQKNDALLESLSIRAEVNKRIQEGVLSEEEGKEYLHYIKTRTDELIGLKVLPKQIVNQRTVVDSKMLIEDFENVKFLSVPENTTGENFA